MIKPRDSSRGFLCANYLQASAIKPFYVQGLSANPAAIAGVAFRSVSCFRKRGTESQQKRCESGPLGHVRGLGRYIGRLLEIGQIERLRGCGANQVGIDLLARIVEIVGTKPRWP